MSDPNPSNIIDVLKMSDNDGKQDGSHSFGEQAPAAHPAHILISDSKVSFRDMDNDGDSDIVVSTPDSGVQYWVENTLGKAADGVFNHSAFAHLIPTAMTVGDVNGDSMPDVVVGHLSGAKIFLNNGEWTAKEIGVVLHSPRKIILEDIDRDGQVDIVIRDSQEVVVSINTNGTFGVQSMFWPNLGDSSLLAVGNSVLTNSSLEIFTMNADSGMLGMISHGAMGWQPVKEISSISTTTLVVKDMNNDGIDDVYITDRDSNQVILRSDGMREVFHPTKATESPNTDIDHTSSGKQAGADADAGTPMITISDEDTPSAAENSDDMDIAHISLRSLPQNAPPKLLSMEPDEPSFDFHAAPDLSYSGNMSDQVDFSTNGLSVYAAESSTKAVIGSAHADFIIANGQSIHIDGGKGNDFLWGDDGDDTLVGGRGDDLLLGEKGDDLIAGQRGNDVLFGDQGDDLMFGGNGEDILFGNSGDDTMLGGAKADLLFGGSGDDLISGGMGMDEIWGDSGCDTFHYSSTLEGGDLIADFTVGKDMFVFEFGTKALHTVHGPYTGNLGFNDEAFIWEVADNYSGVLYYDPNTGLSGDEVIMAEVETTTPDAEFSVDDLLII